MLQKPFMKLSDNSNLNILFILSYYSALQKSVETNNWQPEGMPAVSKLFEEINSRGIKFNVVFTKKYEKRKTKIIKSERFDSLFYTYDLNLKSKSIFKIINPIILFNFYTFIKSILSKHKSNLIYVDRSNLLIASLLSFFGFKVVLRLHGISNFNSNYKSLKYRFLNPLNVLSLYSPFKMIICTNDGSPSEYFLNKFKFSDKKLVLLNGVDSSNHIITSLEKKKTKFFKNNFLTLIFIGRFSNDKGIIEFIKTLIRLKLDKINVNSIIIGDGVLKKEVNSLIANNNLENIHLTGQIEHNQVYSYLEISDVYISLNKLGNLSNTVLEAYKTKKCIIVLDECLKTKKDMSTKLLFNKNIIYINRTNIIDNLHREIIKLNNLDYLNIFKNRIRKSKVLIPSWKERMKSEINLLENI